MRETIKRQYLEGKRYKNYLGVRKRDNYICQLCGKYGNAVHHIDYNKLNCNPNNLITLCRSCHTKTNHNRDYWIKYFNEKIYNGRNGKS